MATWDTGIFSLEEALACINAEKNSKKADILNRDESKRLRCKNKGSFNGCVETFYKCPLHIKELADKALSYGESAKALALYKKAAFINPRYADVWVCIGKLYIQNGNYVKAIAALNKALNIDKTYGEALFNKAIALQKNGCLSDAVDIINRLLLSCNNPVVIAFKEELINSGARDVFRIDTAIEIMTDKALEIASDNCLLDENGKVRIEKDIYVKTEFSSRIFDYCKRKYSPSMEKACSESILTAFYSSLCTTLFFYKDRKGFTDIHPFEYINDHVDLEKADVAAERLLGMKPDDSDAKELWDMIYDYAKFSGEIINKVTSENIDAAILDATESAYVLGMLYAMYHFKKKSSSGREIIDAALKKLAESSTEYENPPPRTAMCYSMSCPPRIEIQFACSKCGKITDLSVYMGDEGLIADYKKLADEFVKIGHKAEFLHLCKECADKRFPNQSSSNANYFVFIFTAKDSVTPVYSFPATWEYRDFEYRVALSFLKGADTIEKLAETTGTRLNADVYLEHVESVIGSINM